MIISAEIIDFRDELYVRINRCWLIIYTLSSGKSVNQKITLQKAAFCDFLIRNPKVLHGFLIKFDRINKNKPLEDILYNSNSDYGASENVNDFLQVVLILQKEKYLTLERVGVEFVITTTDRKMILDVRQVQEWKANLALIKPLLSKSISVLQKSILGESF